MLSPQNPGEEFHAYLDAPAALSSLISCESVLNWPVFYPDVPVKHSIALDVQYEANAALSPDDPLECRRAPGRGVQEEDLVHLSKRFLAYVHVKNPILDIADYKTKVRNAAKEGVAWDGSSCLVVGVKRARERQTPRKRRFHAYHARALADILRSCVPLCSPPSGV